MANEVQNGEWSTKIAPLVNRLTTAVAFDAEVVLDPEGTEALAELLKRMAAKLDRYINRYGDDGTTG